MIGAAARLLDPEALSTQRPSAVLSTGSFAPKDVLAAKEQSKSIESLLQEASVDQGTKTNDVHFEQRKIETASVPAVSREPATGALLAEWNGCVTSIQEHFFRASLRGISGHGVQGEQEDAEIPISDVRESDKELLKPGHFFRLCVFYRVLEDDQPQRLTQVVFRRLPAYRAYELEKAAERADELHRGLRVE